MAAHLRLMYEAAATVQRASPEQPAECYPAVLPTEQPHWRTEQAPHAHPPHCCRTVFIIFFLPETKASAVRHAACGVRHAACGVLLCMLSAAVHAECGPLSSSPAALRLVPPVALAHACPHTLPALRGPAYTPAAAGRLQMGSFQAMPCILRSPCRACPWSAST